MGKGARRDGREDTGSSASDGETVIPAPIYSKFGWGLAFAPFGRLVCSARLHIFLTQYVIIHDTPTR